MKIELTVMGCDNSTTIQLECTETEFEFLKMVAEKVTQTSTYGCMPTMQVEELLT